MIPSFGSYIFIGLEMGAKFNICSLNIFLFVSFVRLFKWGYIISVFVDLQISYKSLLWPENRICSKIENARILLKRFCDFRKNSCMYNQIQLEFLFYYFVDDYKRLHIHSNSVIYIKFITSYIVDIREYIWLLIIWFI